MLKIQSQKYSIFKIILVITYLLCFMMILDKLTQFSVLKLTYTIPSIVIVTLYLLLFYPSLTKLINKSLIFNNNSKILVAIMIILGIMSMFEIVYFNNWFSLLFISLFLVINSILILNSSKDYFLNILFLSIFNQLTFFSFAIITWNKKLDLLFLIEIELLILIFITVHQILLINEFKKSFEGKSIEIQLLQKKN